MSKTIENINKEIGDKKAKVVTVEEMIRIVREIGPDHVLADTLCSFSCNKEDDWPFKGRDQSMVMLL